MNGRLLNLSDNSFPITIIEHKKTHYGPMFKAHSHKNHLQIFYFLEGNADIYCNEKHYNITSPCIFLINNNTIHYGENLSPIIHYFVVRINLKMLVSYNINSCNKKYLIPLINNTILLENLINDNYILHLIKLIITTFKEKKNGYELKLISCTFDFISHLINNHIKFSLPLKSIEILSKKLEIFQPIFDYIENNYACPITTKTLAKTAFMSEGYFCRKFKALTGRTPLDYVNRVRIEKAASLLNSGICNITETAISVGFNDTNYFCRIFKKYMTITPHEYIKNNRRYFI